MAARRPVKGAQHRQRWKAAGEGGAGGSGPAKCRHHHLPRLRFKPCVRTHLQRHPTRLPISSCRSGLGAVRRERASACRPVAHHWESSLWSMCVALPCHAPRAARCRARAALCPQASAGSPAPQKSRRPRVLRPCECRAVRGVAEGRDLVLPPAPNNTEGKESAPPPTSRLQHHLPPRQHRHVLCASTHVWSQGWAAATGWLALGPNLPPACEEAAVHSPLAAPRLQPGCWQAAAAGGSDQPRERQGG